jgi:type II secretory pathway component PulF
MPEPPKELPAFPNEAAFQQKLKERRQRVEELEVEQKPSIHKCAFNSIVWFFLLMVFPILMTYVVPKFKTIFADMLGPGETLPEFTLLILKISDTIQHNALITLPLWGSLWLGFAYFMGFKIRFLEKNLCKIINVLSILLFAFVLLSVIIAMFLPLIKMKDKLGQ